MPIQGTNDAVLFEYVPEGASGVLAAPLTVKQQTWVLLRKCGQIQVMHGELMAMFYVMFPCSDQPTTSRLNKTITTST